MKDIVLFTIDKKEVFKAILVYICIFILVNIFSFLIVTGLIFGGGGLNMIFALVPKYIQEVSYGLALGMPGPIQEGDFLTVIFLQVIISEFIISSIVYFTYYFVRKKNYLGTAIFVIISIFWIAGVVSNLIKLK